MKTPYYDGAKTWATDLPVAVVAVTSEALASGFEAVRGDVVGIVAANENPPRRGTDPLDDTRFVAGLVVDAAVVVFNANDIDGFAGSLNVRSVVLFGSEPALLVIGVAIDAMGAIETIGEIGLILIVSDAAVTAGAMLAPVFGISGVVTADGKLKTDVVVAVLNVTVVVRSPVLNEAVVKGTTTGDSNGFALSSLAPVSTSSRASPSLKQLSIIASLDFLGAPLFLIVKTVDVFAFGFTNEIPLSS